MPLLIPRLPLRSLTLLLLPALFSLPVHAQDTAPSESIRVEVYTPEDQLAPASPDGASQCPSDVSVGSVPVTIRGTASTTSETPVSFLVEFAFSDATLEATATSNRGPFTSTSGGGMTTLRLETTFVVNDPVMYEITSMAIAPGAALYRFRTFVGGSPSRDDTCEFNVIAPMHTLSVQSQPPGVPIDIEVDGQNDGTDTTPFNRDFPENAEVAFTAPPSFDGVPFTQWQNSVVSTNRRFEVTVVTDETVTAIYGEPQVADLGVQLMSLQNGFLMGNMAYLAPDASATLRFEVSNAGPDAADFQVGGSFNPSLLQIQEVALDGGTCGGSGPSFSCMGSLAPNSTTSLEVTLITILTGSTTAGVFVSTLAPAFDPNGENDDAFFGIVITELGTIEGRKRIRLGDDVFRPLDGFEMQLASPQGDLLNTARTTEGGFFQFVVVPGEYLVREEDAPHLSPIDPPTGELAINVIGGQIVVVNFDNQPDLGVDWGDLPDPRSPSDLLDASCVQRGGTDQCYATLSPQGAVHPIRQGLHLGSSVDAENDGQPDATAEGDDLGGNDDEDGVTFVSLEPGGMGEVRVAVALPNDLDEAALFAWIDFNDDGLFDPFAETIIGATVPPGVHTFTFPIPEDAALNFARFRLSSRTHIFGLLLPDGSAFDGEVEDYFALIGVDYGDAPDATDPNRPDIPAGYPTELFDDGARHIATTTIRLGDSIDSDRDGQPTTTGDGDDQDNLYDEDGIRFQDGFFPISVRPEPKAPGGVETRYGIARGTDGTILPLASIDGKLDAWIDFNRDGDWDDPGEQIFDSEDVQTGPDFTPLTFTVPEGAAPGFTFARFRFSRNGNLDFDGPAPDGEVEDYLLRILGRSVVTTVADSGPASLRQVLLDAIAAGQFALIDLRGLSKQAANIQLQSPLPTLTVPLILHGGGTELDGSGAGAADGLVLAAGSNIITGLTVHGFSGHGIVIESDGNLVENSTFTANGGDGLRVLGSGNILSRNAVLNNGGLGIDLGGDGPTTNDPGDADGRQNAPIIIAVAVTDSARVEGTLISSPATAFALEFFENEGCDDSGQGEGATFLGATTVVTDANGQADFEVAFAGLLPPGRVVTATATGSAGTSEYSQCQVSTDTDTVANLPHTLRLHPNYPNPFNPATTLVFDLPETSTVGVEVLDLLGRRVLMLPPRHVEAGVGRTLVVDASALASGVYLYRIIAEGVTGRWATTGRMMLVR